MMRVPIFLLGLLAATIAVADVYKWQDESGRWHYGDTPAPGADRVDLPSVQVYSSPSLPMPNTGQRDKQRQEPPLSYARVDIVSPGAEETIRNSTGEVGVAVVLEPGLRSGHLLQLLLDNAPVAEPSASTAYTLNNIDRGAHTLSVEVLDQNGGVVARSDPQTFYLHRPIVRPSTKN